MNSWTTCFVAALVLAGAGALWLGLSAPPRPHAVAERLDLAQGERPAGGDAAPVQRLSATSD